MISCDNFLAYSFTDPGTMTFINKDTQTLPERVSIAVDATQTNNMELASEVYDLIRLIKDPEKPQTLEELNVVSEEGVTVNELAGDSDAHLIRIEFVPTVPHCSLATLIGLTLRAKLERNLLHKFKLDIFIRKGTHSTEDEINKQINDKERIAAAMENPNLLTIVNSCVEESDY